MTPSSKQCKLLNVGSIVRKTQSLFVGGSNYVFIPELKKGKLWNVVEDYYSVSKVVYITATKYILSKFLTNIKLLMTFSAIDPIVFSLGQFKTQRLLNKSEFFFPTCHSGKKQSYLGEVNRILVDKTLLNAITGDGSIGLNKSESVMFNNSKCPYFICCC